MEVSESNFWNNSRDVSTSLDTTNPVAPLCGRRDSRKTFTSTPRFAQRSDYSYFGEACSVAWYSGFL